MRYIPVELCQNDLRMLKNSCSTVDDIFALKAIAQFSLARVSDSIYRALREELSLSPSVKSF